MEEQKNEFQSAYDAGILASPMRTIDSHHFAMWFELLRPHKILEDAVAAVWNEIEADAEMTIINGAPSASL